MPLPVVTWPHLHNLPPHRTVSSALITSLLTSDTPLLWISLYHRFLSPIPLQNCAVVLLWYWMITFLLYRPIPCYGKITTFICMILFKIWYCITMVACLIRQGKAMIVKSKTHVLTSLSTIIWLSTMYCVWLYIYNINLGVQYRERGFTRLQNH